MPTEKSFLISEATGELIDQAIAWQRNFRVSGARFINTPKGASLAIGGNAAGGVDGVEYLDALITGSSRDGSNWRWVYTFAQAEKTAAGYDGWTNVASGITGDCYNRAEEINADTGLMGNGVDIDTLPSGFEMQPIPDGTPVRLEIVFVDNGDGDAEYWFSMPNGVDGTCGGA